MKKENPIMFCNSISLKLSWLLIWQTVDGAISAFHLTQSPHSQCVPLLCFLMSENSLVNWSGGARFESAVRRQPKIVPGATA